MFYQQLKKENSLILVKIWSDEKTYKDIYWDGKSMAKGVEGDPEKNGRTISNGVKHHDITNLLEQHRMEDTDREPLQRRWHSKKKNI